MLKKNHKTLFTPVLPSWKVRAIEKMGFGNLEKIFLEFEKPFWPMDRNVWVSYDFLWTPEELKSLQGTDREW